MVEGENMTVLNLEDSKALYDAGIRIKTKKCWANEFCPVEEKIGYILGDYTIYRQRKEDTRPAPDLEELLEYAPLDTHLSKHRLIIPSGKEDGMFPDNQVIYAAYTALKPIRGNTPSGDTPAKALSNLLLKLKEEGYDL
jgi:hypothetical protein